MITLSSFPRLLNRQDLTLYKDVRTLLIVLLLDLNVLSDQRFALASKPTSVRSTHPSSTGPTGRCGSHSNWRAPFQTRSSIEIHSCLRSLKNSVAWIGNCTDKSVRVRSLPTQQLSYPPPQCNRHCITISHGPTQTWVQTVCWAAALGAKCCQNVVTVNGINMVS